MAGVIEASEDGAFDMASIAVPEELKKQWKLKAAQRRCTQCIDNEAADAYAAADPAVIRAKNEYLRARKSWWRWRRRGRSCESSPGLPRR